MELTEILERVITGNCILFTGSGFTFGAKNLIDESPVTAWALTEKMYRECGIDESDNDLKNASQFYIESFSESALIELLKKSFTIKSVSDSHLTVSALPWKRIYTTNYDNALELAFTQNGKLLTPIVLSDRIDQYRDKRTICVHLNGYIDRLTPSSLYKDFKLTDLSYLTTEFISSPWVDLFRSDVETSNLVVFIGFSLNSDLDLSRIISSYSNKKNLIFIVKPNESNLLVKKLERFGTVLPIGIDDFAKAVTKKKETFEPSNEKQIFLQSFEQALISVTPNKIKDIDVFDLFFKGNSETGFIHHSLNNPIDYKYYIKRHQLDEVIQSIEGGARNVLIHSDLGNGKTLFLDGLADRLTNLHYNIYRFSKYTDKTFEEIEYLCTRVNKCIIIIEKYSDHFDLLRKITLLRTQETTIIVSERTVVNDTTYLILENIIFSQNYITKNLNKLSDAEISEFADILTTYGLWGSYSSRSSYEKRRIIADQCKSSLRLTLLFLLDSPDIKNRFNQILKFIKNANESFFNATLLILASNYFDFPLDLDKLTYILDDELLTNPSFNNNDQLKEVINFSNHKITVRSSILALSLLSQSEYHNILINLLIKVFKKLDKRSADKNNYQILKAWYRFRDYKASLILKRTIIFEPLS